MDLGPEGGGKFFNGVLSSRKLPLSNRESSGQGNGPVTTIPASRSWVKHGHAEGALRGGGESIGLGHLLFDIVTDVERQSFLSCVGSRLQLRVRA